MSDVNTVSFSDLVRLAPFKWTEALNSISQNARNSGLFKVTAWEAGTGDTYELTSVNLEEYASIKDESDQAETARFQQGYPKTIGLRRFGKDISVSWETRRRNKYDTVLQQITDLGTMLAKRMDLDLSHRITFGTATSYVDKDGRTVDTSVGDALALFSTAHLIKGSATTFRNRLANNPQLSRGSLEGMEKMAVENTINEFGEKMALEHDILFTTDDPNTVNTARELLQATSKISAPNEGVPNVNQAKYKHVRLPRVATTAAGLVDSTKAKYWGIASSAKSSAMLRIEQEPALNVPTDTSNATDVSTEDRTFTARGSWSIGIKDANWIKFSDGLGTA